MIGLAGFLLLCLLIYLFFCIRKKRAGKKVCRMGCEQKQRMLNEALSPFGFLYEEKDDSITSDMYPWQREMGYCRAYDEGAPSMSMVIDSEPVYFRYQEKNYLLECWKGQYGCTTGAEIGLYVNREAGGGKKPEKLFYECAEDEERLPMWFTLYKKDRIILRRQSVHWWLTGFVVGMFSENRELRMEVGIGFPNRGMCMAFCQALMCAGYRPEEIRVEQNRVSFTFDRPRSAQPDFYSRSCLRRVNRRNRRSCRWYCLVTKCFCSVPDKICYIRYCFPILFCTVRNLGTGLKPRKLRRFRRKWEKRS